MQQIPLLRPQKDRDEPNTCNQKAEGGTFKTKARCKRGPTGVSPAPSLLLLLAQAGIPWECGRQLILQKSRKLFGCLFEKRTAWVGTVHVQIQVLLGGARVATILTDIELVPALLICILLLYAVDLLQVGLQGAALGEGFAADVTFVGADACKGDGQMSADGHGHARASQLGSHLNRSCTTP